MFRMENEPREVNGIESAGGNDENGNRGHVPLPKCGRTASKRCIIGGSARGVYVYLSEVVRKGKNTRVTVCDDVTHRNTLLPPPMSIATSPHIRTIFAAKCYART